MSMTNYEGEISIETSQVKIPMQPSDDPDEIFELASVQTSDYDTDIHVAISSCYKGESQDISHYDTDSGFVLCLNLKLDISNFGATIGSTTSFDEDCCLSIDQTLSTMSQEELEKSLSFILDES